MFDRIVSIAWPCSKDLTSFSQWPSEDSFKGETEVTGGRSEFELLDLEALSLDLTFSFLPFSDFRCIFLCIYPLRGQHLLTQQHANS